MRLFVSGCSVAGSLFSMYLYCSRSFQKAMKAMKAKKAAPMKKAMKSMKKKK